VTLISQQQLESYLWGAAVLLRGTIDAGDYKQFIFPLLFLKRLCDVFDEETQAALAESGGDEAYAAFPEHHRFQIPPGAHWRDVRRVTRDVGAALQGAMRAIETANPEKLYGIFGDAQWTNKDRLTDAMLRDLVEHFSTLELTIANLPEDALGQGYEYLIKQFADDSGHTAAEFYTNRTVVHLMTELLQPRPGESIYDPTCGSGGMLLSCIAHLRRRGLEWRNVRLYGQERNLMTSAIARMNCFLHGIEDFQIVRGDTLAQPAFVQGDRLMRFDVVLANPPYSIKQWDRPSFAADPWGRNLYGTPPQGRADYAFWQHILCSLAPENGRCAILFPHGVLFRQEEAEMRRKLIEADLIECIIGLGPNLFYNSPMEACVVVCRARKPEPRRGRVLFINAVNAVTRERAQSFMTEEHIARIACAYEAFADQPGFASVASLEQVRAQGGNLSIPLYVSANGHPGAARVDGRAALAEALDDWLASRAAVADSLRAILPDLPLPELDVPLGRLEECGLFDRRGWQRVRFDEMAQNVNERVEPSEAPDEIYVGLEHLEAQDLHIRRWGKGSDVIGTKLRFRKGDLIFGRRRAYQRKLAVAEFDGICSAHAMVVRARPEIVLPDFLPFLMMSDRFMNRAVEVSVGSLSPTINWSTLKREEFDLPPLDQQRRIAELLWAVDEVKARYGILHSRAVAMYDARLAAAFGNGTSRRTLGEVLTYASDGPFGSKLKTEHYADGGARVIRLQNISAGGFDDSDRVFISESYFAELRRYEIRPGDVLVAGLGDETHPVGRAAIVPALLGPVINKADCFCLRGDAHTMCNQYIAYFLNSPLGRTQILARAQGTTRLRINVSNLKGIAIPLVSLSEQMRLVNELRQVESHSESIQAQIGDAAKLLRLLIEALIS
jgi:type I restriction enzyme M protein